MTSTEMVRRLVARGFALGTARQILRRDYEEAKIWRSESLVLEAGARLYARKSFYGDAAFLEELRPVLLRERKGIARSTIVPHDPTTINTLVEPEGGVNGTRS